MNSTWVYKRNDCIELPKIVTLTGKMSQKWGKGTMVIPSPNEIDSLIRQVPAGKVVTQNDLREAIARRHGTTVACPITTGIFTWICAYAAEEERASGIKNIAPYWRVLKTGGLLNEKYPGGAEVQKRRLEEEGLTIVQRGKRLGVFEYDKRTVRLK